jgi:hypothetical protein
MGSGSIAEQAQKFCNFCPHPEHGTTKCAKCRCKGKQRWWQSALSGLGNAIGESLFGGSR